MNREKCFTIPKLDLSYILAYHTQLWQMYNSDVLCAYISGKQQVFLKQGDKEKSAMCLVEH